MTLKSPGFKLFGNMADTEINIHLVKENKVQDGESTIGFFFLNFYLRRVL